MVTICPTIDVFDTNAYKQQMNNIRSFAPRVHIDMMDGDFTPVTSPGMADIWWPHTMIADIHLMYRRPMDHIAQLINLKPHMVIVHAEAEVHHMHFAAEMHKHNILAGLCILQETPVENIKQILHSFDQILVFSGHLGYQGGVIDMNLTHKVSEIKEYYPEIEIAWDGGVNDTNIVQLQECGVTVFNVGGFIQKSDNPEKAYATLEKKLKSE